MPAETWVERDEMILEAIDAENRHPLLSWSLKHKIVWPSCPRQCWALIHAAPLFMPAMSHDNPYLATCRAYLKERGIRLIPDGVDTPWAGVLTFCPRLKLA